MKALKDIVIHIGAPKTGSSAIQFLLNSNRLKLQGMGFYYPKHGVDGNSISGGHSIFSKMLIDDDLKGAQDWLDSQYEKAQQRNNKLLISAEGLYLQHKKLKTLLKGKRVTIIGYLRHPIEAIVSNYNQGVKRAYFTSSLIEHCEKILKHPTQKFMNGGILIEWQEIFGRENTILKAYDKNLFPKEKIEYDFLSLLGISGLKRQFLSITKRDINPSYSPSAIALKRVLNSFIKDKDIKTNNKIDVLLQQYSEKVDEKNTAIEDQLGHKLYRELLKHFEHDLQTLTNSIFEQEKISYWKEKRLLNNEIRKSGIVYSNIYALESILSVNEDITNYLKQCIQEAIDNDQVSHQAQEIIEYFQMSYSDRFVSINDVLKKVDKIVTEIDKKKYDNADLYRELALFYLNCGDRKSARIFIEDAIRLRPNGPFIKNIHKRLIS